MSGERAVFTNLLSLYMEYVLELSDDQAPSLEGFCQYAEISHSEFFEHFDKVQTVEKEIWKFMFTDAVNTALSDPQHENFEQDEKLLSLLYTFFENLTLNRTYFVKHLDMRKGLRQKRKLFSLLKEEYSNYISTTIDREGLLAKGLHQIEIVREVVDRSQEEAFWIQLLCLIDFWHKDTSDEQSKTDIAIEKSVRAAIDLIEAAPVRSVVDLGKFIWQERIQNSKED